jgi:hypothetical protein
VTDELCIHDLAPASCTICLHGVQDKPAVTIVIECWAQFDGACRGCNLPIVPEQWIYRLSDGSYVHRGCEPVGTSR